MLRSLRHVAVPPPGIEPRSGCPDAIFEPPPDRTLVVRGRMRAGGAAALILEPGAVSVVSADKASRCRLRRFTLSEVLSVEEHRTHRSMEIVIVTATVALAIVDVDVAQAWTFCREVRQLILQHASSPTRN